MHKLLLPALILATVFCCGCKKNSSLPVDSNNLADVKYIFLTVKDSAGGGIICINPDKTTRWLRTGLAVHTPVWVYYSDGIIYAPYSEYNAATAEGHGNFYAIDASTGKDIWTIKHSADIFYNVYVHNGSLYAYVQTVAGFYLVALDAKTGKQQWRVPLNVSWATDFTAEGNMLYFNEAVSNTNISLTAFNLTTKTIAWQTQTNAYNNVFSGVIIKVKYLYVPGYSGAVSAVEKATGKIAWTAPGVRKGNIANIDNSIYYINGDSKLCAISISDGAAAWQTPAMQNDAHIHAAGQHLYVTGSNPSPYTNGVYAVNAQDGSVQWQKELDALHVYPVLAGGNLYVYNATTHTIVMLDAATGNPQGAITINGTSDGYCEIVTADGKLVTPD